MFSWEKKREFESLTVVRREYRKAFPNSMRYKGKRLPTDNVEAGRRTVTKADKEKIRPVFLDAA